MRTIRLNIYIALIVIIVITGSKLEMKLNEYRIAQDIHQELILDVRQSRDDGMVLLY